MDKQAVKQKILTENYAQIWKRKSELEVDFETVTQKKPKSSNQTGL